MAAPSHDWYLTEWLATLGKKQEAIATELGWNKAKASLMRRGKQPYTRDAINEISAWLHLSPYELLMHPDDAMAIRKLYTEAGKVREIGERLHLAIA